MPIVIACGGPGGCKVLWMDDEPSPETIEYEITEHQLPDGRIIKIKQAYTAPKP